MGELNAKCPYCGHEESGEWHDGQRICYYCGRHFRAEEKKAPEEVWTGPTKPVVIVHMRAQAANTVREDTAVFPYRDGEYKFEGKEYPFTKFSGIKIENDVVWFDGVPSKLTVTGFEIRRTSTAYDHSGVGWPETLDIKIYTDRVPDKDQKER